ncbi:MAG TPA: 2-succinyl-5-enolpyruvyl-6-hydroxy-3-cyclohexene-1-carboxylic-acid synthase [Acidimicrobiales bacterium]|nr:2-succinyl-5-enolpyruvyl-6-hydroxy-3-cyclohexene-1-carboxylic-acid synthase [Acidimicrobiales bacterium]
MATSPADTQATFCATLVDEWVRSGVTDAVVAPGSRSTPLALALAGEPRLRLHVHHDERSAAFLAIGLSLVTGEPTVVLTTSGTAAVELHPAVVEADLAGVPLLVCTADRPAELIDVGAPQAIDQIHLYGRAVRWAHAPGVADAATASRWRPLAARAYAEATGGRPGPVHLDLAFREPLLGTAGPLPAAREGGGPWVWRSALTPPSDPLIGPREDLQGRRGVILAGPGSGDGEAVAALAAALGWPVLAAPQAEVWQVPDATITAADGFLRDPAVAEALRPEVVLHLGLPLASRVVGEWAAASGATHVVAAGPGRWVDAHGVAAVVLDDPVDPLLEAWGAQLEGVVPVEDGRWRQRWGDVAAAAVEALEGALVAAPCVTEPGSARTLLDALPAGARLVASSSMPVRDLEWYGPGGRRVTVLANRGANGIDGIVSTAVGVAAASSDPTALLIGDIAFLHDSNGLLGAAARGLDLVMVVIDNDGGGIFSFLPQADALDSERFELLFGTPHGLDLAALAAVHGIATATIRADDSLEALRAAVDAALAAGGVHVVVVRSDRGANRALHQRINEAVGSAARHALDA